MTDNQAYELGSLQLELQAAEGYVPPSDWVSVETDEFTKVYAPAEIAHTPELLRAYSHGLESSVLDFLAEEQSTELSHATTA